MEIYAKFQDGLLEDISPVQKPLYDKYTVTDSDFFVNYRFYTANENMELIVNPIYKKLGENEYFVAKAPNFMHLIKPKYEVANGTFITIDSEDKLVELSRHLNDYYYIDENNDLQINQEKKDAFLRQDIIKSFKLEREKYFKV